MAIYHLTTKSVSRNDSRSAREAATYILRTGDYARDHDEVVYEQSGHMPTFAGDPITYWKAADRHERRNGRLYQSIEYALPVELDDDGRRDLAVQFAHRLTATEKLPYTFAIHEGKGHNPHCHLIISERRNDGIARSRRQWFRRFNAKEPEHGGARKSTSLRPREWLRETRRAWADLCNMALESAEHDDRIDHRTLVAQGIARKPGKHLGPERHEMLQNSMDVRIAKDISMTTSDIGPPRALYAPTPRPGAPDGKGRGGGLRTPDTAEERTAEKIQRHAIQRQARAMKCVSYKIGILNTDSGELDEYEWTLQQILENLKLLRQLNAQGREILLRPNAPPLTGLILVEGLSLDNVNRMVKDGYEPTLRLETAAGQHQVWVRVEDGHTKSRRDKIARHLAENYGGDVDAAGANSYGRLAGFAVTAPSTGISPFALIRQSVSSGKIISGAEKLLSATRPATKQPEDGPAPGGDLGAG